MPDTYVIAFQAGSYGNFVGWTLRWLSDPRIGICDRPWDDVMNNSHKWDCVYHEDMEDACTNVISGSLVHPIQTKACDLSFNIDRLLTCYGKVILLHPTAESCIWTLNNKFERVWPEGWFNHHSANYKGSLSRWNGSSETWEKREFLSFYFHDQHKAENMLSLIPSIMHDRLLKVKVEDLRDRFKSTIRSICEFINLQPLRTERDLMDLHVEWLSKQPHMHKDMLIEKTVNAILQDIDTSMAGLTLVDTAEIQRMLRYAGYEIRCYGLNDWPTTTSELKKLLYRKNDEQDQDS